MTMTVTPDSVVADLNFDEPQFEVLFPDLKHCEPMCSVDVLCGDCDVARSNVYTPRTMAFLSTQAWLMWDVWRGLEIDGFYQSVLCRYLPPITHRASLDWYARFTSCFGVLAERIDAGQVPFPRSRAEELALHIVLDVCIERTARSGEGLSDRLFGDDTALPALFNDGDFVAMKESMLGNTDVLALFDGRLASALFAWGEEKGMKHLEPRDWFDAFNSSQASRNAGTV